MLTNKQTNEQINDTKILDNFSMETYKHETFYQIFQCSPNDVHVDNLNLVL